MCLQASQFKAWDLMKNLRGWYCSLELREGRGIENTFPRACSSGSHCEHGYCFFYKGGWKDNLQMCAHVIALGEGWGFIFQAMSPFSPEQLCGEGQL